MFHLVMSEQMGAAVPGARVRAGAQAQPSAAAGRAANASSLRSRTGWAVRIERHGVLAREVRLLIFRRLVFGRIGTHLCK